MSIGAAAAPEQVDLAFRILHRHAQGARGDVTRPLARTLLRHIASERERRRRGRR